MARLESLRSPAFLLAVAVLVLNDFVLKAAFGNWLTGKLSDVAGVWAFGYFVLVLTRWPRPVVAAIIAAGFTFWKSPAAAGVIQAWNSVAWPAVGRTVDPTDLLALLVLLLLPANVSAGSVPARGGHRGLVNAAIALSAVLAFAATSRKGDNVCCEAAFQFAGTEEALIARLESIGARHVSKSEKLSGENGTFYSFFLPDEFCGSSVMAAIRTREENARTLVTLDYLNYNCANRDDAAVQELFDRTIVSKLQ